MVRIRDCLSCGEGSIPSITAKLRFVMQLEDMLVLETESCGFDSHRIDTYRRSTVVVARDSYPLGRWFKSTRRYKENRMFASAYVRFESDQLTWVQVPSKSLLECSSDG